MSETGEVTTLRVPGALALSTGPSTTRVDGGGLPLVFQSPTGIAVDPFGTIYVTEPDSNQVRAALPNGNVVSAAQADTFAGPTGIFVSQGGRVVVADRQATARRIVYGQPEIHSVTPSTFSDQGGAQVGIIGKNFAPETVVVVAGKVVDITLRNTGEIAFTAPRAQSGRTVVTVQHRGGVAQASVFLEPIPLGALPPGYITTVVGGSSFAGERQLATEVPMTPEQVALGPEGDLYFVNRDKQKVQRISATTGILTTVAGTGGPVEVRSPSGTPATATPLESIRAIHVDASGNLFIVAMARILKVDSASPHVSPVR